jgi:hypothetical protein
MEAQQISQDSTKTMSAIDRALAAARARAAQRAAIVAAEARDPAASEDKQTAPKAAAEKQPKVKDEATKAAAEEARAQRKAERDADREKRKAEKAAAAEGKKSHMKKVERAASKLPALSSEAKSKLNELRLELSNVELTALSAHILHHVRATATVAAAGKRPGVGAKVKIVGGDPKFVGMVGTVVDSRPLRCFVEVQGAKKPVYLFNSEVSMVDADETEAAD